MTHIKIAFLFALLAFPVYSQALPVNTTWDIQFSGTPDLNPDSHAYDVDLFDTAQSMIAAYKANGHYIICYMSAGSYENWRPDAKKFPRSVKGKSNGWAGENWLDIRNIKVLQPIMASRMDLARQKGCDAIDADNVDGYTNNTGFKLKASDQLTYNKMLAQLAHERGMEIGLKNDLLQIAQLEPYFDFAINESCFVYDECYYMDPFINAGKAVLSLDYQGDDAICFEANDMGFSMIIKDNLLSAGGTFCWE